MVQCRMPTGAPAKVYTPTGHVATPTVELPPPFASPEERLKYIGEQVDRVLAARAACDVVVPLRGETPTQAQSRLYRVFLIRNGAALGMLGLALREGLIAPEQYARFTNMVRDTLLPTQVGEIVKGNR